MSRRRIRRYSMCSIKDGGERRARGIHELRGQESTAWMHKSFRSLPKSLHTRRTPLLDAEQRQVRLSGNVRSTISRKSASALFIAALSLLASEAAAEPVVYSFGLTNPVAVVGFDGFSDGQSITTVNVPLAHTSVDFGGKLYATNFAFTGTPAPVADNFLGSVVNDPFQMQFSTPQANVLFYIYSDGFGGTVTSYLNGVQVEQSSVGQYHPSGDNYFGFVNSRFDSIVVSLAGDGLAQIDNVEFGAAPAPEPQTFLLLSGGLLLILARRLR